MKTNPKPLCLIPILLAGVFCVSFGSILVRLGHEAPSLTIAMYRMCWTSLLLLPFYLTRRVTASSINWKLQLAAGVALALHFAFWISSLRFTSVAVSVLLVNTSPIFVAILSYVLFRERLTFFGFLGLASAFAGTLVLLWNDVSQLGKWEGCLLAILGAAALGAYLLLGRKLRQDLSLIEYVFPTYVIAALTLSIICVASSQTLFGFSYRTHVFLFLLGLVPQCLGHTSYNWALEHLSATTIASLILAEPVLATLLAWWILGESVGLYLIAGGALVGLGILLITRWGIQEAAQPLTEKNGQK